MSGVLFMMRLWKYVDAKKLDNKRKANIFLIMNIILWSGIAFLLWIQCRMGGVDSDHYWLCRNRNRILWRSYLLYASGIRIFVRLHKNAQSGLQYRINIDKSGWAYSFIYGSRSFTYFAALLRRSSSIAA